MKMRSLPTVVGSLVVVLLLTFVAEARAEAPRAALLAPCDGGSGIYLYADRDYGGACLKVTGDIPRLSELGFNDMTSSIRFVGLFSGGHRAAELYVDGNYGGNIQVVHDDVPWMGETVVGDDRLSSVRVGYRCAGVTTVPQAECQALVDLYNAASGPSWTRQDNWLVSGSPCHWWGIWCGGDHVTELNLFNNGLVGSIPASLGNLSGLATLALDWNQLSGGIPASLGNIGTLRTLALGSNRLSGGIPASLGNLANLEYLSLDHNQLTGGIPGELGNLGRLKTLSLDNNLLSGGIPAALGNLAKVSWMNLSVNGLTGNIPASFRYLKTLVTLWVSDNPLGGALPTALMEMTALQAFHFENTGLCEPPDVAFQAWLGSMLECGRTNFLCSQPSPTPTATGIASPTPTLTATGTGVPGITPTPTGTRTGTAAARLYLPVVLRGYSLWADDEFSAPVLNGRWRWVNEDPAGWSLTARPGYLRIRTHPDVAWGKNVLLQTPPNGDWGVRTHVSMAPVANFQSAGIVVWGGAGDMLRLARSYCDLGPPNCVGDGIYFDRFEGGEWVGSNYAIPWPGGSPVHLGIERVGGAYHGYCSLDGTQWTWLGSHTPGFAVSGVGLTASQGTPGATNDADFDYFRVPAAGALLVDEELRLPVKVLADLAM